MKLPTRLLRRGCLFLIGLLLSYLISYSSHQVPPTVAAETVSIVNVGAANFRTVPNGPVQNATSNRTSFTAVVDQAALELTKTGDRASAEPGDTVIYRLLLRNRGTVPVTNLVIEDRLPFGLRLIPNSPRASLVAGSTTTPVNLPPATVSGQNIAFNYPRLEPNEALTVAYAVVVTPDAVRGTGRNLAVTTGTVFNRQVRSNSASHLLQIRPGILSDCGTIIGRVFVDKNFDGEQQPGEPGVPNAVVFMDDGNRILTDPEGLFSLANVIAGNRTGVLDLTSLPGYTLAPNLYRIEANSQSRLVRLAPGGLVRMNFAVTPTFGEGQQ